MMMMMMMMMPSFSAPWVYFKNRAVWHCLQWTLSRVSATKARFPVSTTRVDGPSWWVTGFRVDGPSTTGHVDGPSTRLVETGLKHLWFGCDIHHCFWHTVDVWLCCRRLPADWQEWKIYLKRALGSGRTPNSPGGRWRLLWSRPSFSLQVTVALPGGLYTMPDQTDRSRQNRQVDFHLCYH